MTSDELVKLSLIFVSVKWRVYLPFQTPDLWRTK